MKSKVLANQVEAGILQTSQPLRINPETVLYKSTLVSAPDYHMKTLLSKLTQSHR